MIKQQLRHMSAEQRYQRGDHLGCGDMYMEIYNEDPDAERNDEVLYNAAVCYETAGSAGASITILEQINSRRSASCRAGRAGRRRAGSAVHRTLTAHA